MLESLTTLPRYTKIYTGDRADSRLRALGLSLEHLTTALTTGDEKRNLCSPLHPLTFPGQVMWAETTAALRMQLIPSGNDWSLGRLDGYETIYSARFNIGIAVAGGNAFTGIDGVQNPSFTRKKGSVTDARLSRNRALSNAPMLEPFQSIDEAESKINTWFLLCNAREGQLFAELSLPLQVGTASDSSVWSERILLPALSAPLGVTPVSDDELRPQPPTIVVERRR